MSDEELKPGDKVKVYGYCDYIDCEGHDGSIAQIQGTAHAAIKGGLWAMGLHGANESSAVHPRQCEKYNEPREWVLSASPNPGDDHVFRAQGPALKSNEVIKVVEVLE